MFSKYLSYTDRTGEIAFAVLMVIIINGYVALSNLNTGFLYIVAVNLGACFGWGVIDGLIYAVSSSMERNNARNKLIMLKECLKTPNMLEQVKSSLDDTYLGTFSEEGKTAVAKEIMNNVSDAKLDGTSKVLTKEEILGWFSIVGIYMTVGFLMALPFLVFPDKLLAWFLSNIFGVAWVTWYGIQLGKSAGKNRWLLGLIMALVAVGFLAGSYVVWSGQST